MPARKKVLFICTHNSARSQMAETLLNSMCGERYSARSAGTQPSGVDPRAALVMAEEGIDISKNRSRHVNDFAGERFDYIVKVCDKAKESCSVFPGGGEVIHAGFKYPAGYADWDKALENFRKTRDEIRAWINKRFNPI
ncbi:MAG: arsenate reductase ArsC [Candidatus Altiarchaeota archaeon]|nr:arsenate reductase ArsC [Candidatus Altiarchaeota archaeon]